MEYLLGHKAALIKLLNDDEIKHMILEIAGSSRENMQDTIASLKKQIIILTNDLEKEKKDNIIKEKKIQELLAHNEELVKKVNSSEYLIDIWTRIQSLEAETLEYLDGLCGCRDIKAYIALGKDFSRVKQLWTFIESKAIDDEYDERNISVLNDYFNMCIETYNITGISERRLKPLDVSEGDIFNSEICIKNSKSTFNGKISKILIKGYADYKGNTIFKAIVKTQS